MRKMLIAATIALLGAGSCAWADGPMIGWNKIVGVNRVCVQPPTVMSGGPGCSDDGYKPGPVAGIGAAGVWVLYLGGRVMLNLSTGFIAIDVEGASYAEHRENPNAAALGSPITQPKAGTIVCRRATGDDWEYGLAFLVRNVNTEVYPDDPENGLGACVGFGIGRTIQSTE